VAITLEGRSIKVSVDEGPLAETAKLNGCYVLKTDIPCEAALKEIIHFRYKGLAQVEWRLIPLFFR
jgi:hypothetical protein